MHPTRRLRRQNQRLYTRMMARWHSPAAGVSTSSRPPKSTWHRRNLGICNSEASLQVVDCDHDVPHRPIVGLIIHKIVAWGRGMDPPCKYRTSRHFLHTRGSMHLFGSCSMYCFEPPLRILYPRSSGNVPNMLKPCRSLRLAPSREAKSVHGRAPME